MKQYENELYSKGYKYICGTDEAGRGCIAGPLVVASCILPIDYLNKDIKDSKKLNKHKRKALAEIIKANALCYDIKVYSPEFVDLNNPKRTAIIGMQETVNNLKIKPDIVLTDFEKIQIDIDQINLIKGDSLSQTIAAASILAKATRDEIMDELDLKYPEYDFKNNQGYLNIKIKQKILNNELKYIKGVHRKTYKPFKDIIK